jgi:hypothetical protein
MSKVEVKNIDFKGADIIFEGGFKELCESKKTKIEAARLLKAMLKYTGYYDSSWSGDDVFDTIKKIRNGEVSGLTWNRYTYEDLDNLELDSDEKEEKEKIVFSAKNEKEFVEWLEMVEKEYPKIEEENEDEIDLEKEYSKENYNAEIFLSNGVGLASIDIDKISFETKKVLNEMIKHIKETSDTLEEDMEEFGEIISVNVEELFVDDFHPEITEIVNRFRNAYDAKRMNVNKSIEVEKEQKSNGGLKR